MDAPRTTCWTLIAGAARGVAADRDEFARRYRPVIEAYLGARWRGTPLAQEIDDAAQELFVECLRPGGLLDGADRDKGGFRAYFFGAARNIARRAEARRARAREKVADSARELDAIAEDSPALSRVFDRAWALAVLREALGLLVERASASGDDALRRVDLLRLRFEDGLAIRAIAERWNTDAALVHEWFRRARREFKDALLATVSTHLPGTRADVERECVELLGLLAAH
jgi:RNA polymerase sigma-70 factor (ECF subfamily)